MHNIKFRVGASAKALLAVMKSYHRRHPGTMSADNQQATHARDISGTDCQPAQPQATHLVAFWVSYMQQSCDRCACSYAPAWHRANGKTLLWSHLVRVLLGRLPHVDEGVDHCGVRMLLPRCGGVVDDIVLPARQAQRAETCLVSIKPAKPARMVTVY